MHKTISMIITMILFVYRGRLIIFLDISGKIGIIFIQRFITNNKAQILKDNNIEILL